MTAHSRNLVIRELSPAQYHSRSRQSDLLGLLSSPSVVSVFTCLCRRGTDDDAVEGLTAFRHASPGDSLLDFAYDLLVEGFLSSDAFALVGLGADFGVVDCEELFNVLALHEKHAVVIPRSNAVDISILPREFPDGHETSAARPRELTTRVFAKTSHVDVRFRVAPFADGSVAAIRSVQFVNYFLETRSRAGAGVSLRDYSIFINEMGYSSILANRALALSDTPHHQAEAESPTRDWDAYIAHVYNAWRTNDVGAVEAFASLFARNESKPRVLIDASALPAIINGTSRNTTTFLTKLELDLDEGRVDWDVTVLISDEARIALGVASKAMSFRTIGELGRETFDVGVCITPVSTTEQLLRLNRACLRWMMYHLDIIALRALPFLSQDVSAKAAVHRALEFMDSVIFISTSSVVDVAAFFPDLTERIRKTGIVTLQGALVPPRGVRINNELEESQISDLESGYVLIMGNSYPHKQVAKAQSALAETGLRIVSFGGRSSDEKNIRVIPSGKISDAGMDTLLDKAAVVVFPSAYEGFGLPIADIAQAGKTCVLFDTDVAREVASAMSLSGRAFFFDDFHDLPNKVFEAMNLQDQAGESPRTLDDFNNDVIAQISRVLALDPDIENLRRRWSFFMDLETLSMSLTSREIARGKNRSLAARVLSRFQRPQ